MRNKYDVQGYLTHDDYNLCKFNVMHGSISVKREAIRLARKILKKKKNPFAIMKVRSWDGEWSQLFTPKPVKKGKRVKG